jgi:LysR family carnitine catabolism transcriptional activator
LQSPSIERRIGLMRLPDHKLSAAAHALMDVLLEHTAERRQ